MNNQKFLNKTQHTVTIYFYKSNNAMFISLSIIIVHIYKLSYYMIKKKEIIILRPIE